MTAETHRFLQSWRQIQELFAIANPATKRELVQHFIESVEWAPSDPKGRTGWYRLTFFPEVVKARDDTHRDTIAALPDPGKNEIAPVLSPVRDSVRLTPRSERSSKLAAAL